MMGLWGSLYPNCNLEFHHAIIVKLKQEYSQHKHLIVSDTGEHVFVSWVPIDVLKNCQKLTKKVSSFTHPDNGRMAWVYVQRLNGIVRSGVLVHVPTDRSITWSFYSEIARRLTNDTQSCLQMHLTDVLLIRDSMINQSYKKNDTVN